jgi:hypothetical protein
LEALANTDKNISNRRLLRATEDADFHVKIFSSSSNVVPPAKEVCRVLGTRGEDATDDDAGEDGMDAFFADAFAAAAINTVLKNVPFRLLWDAAMLAPRTDLSANANRNSQNW